MVVIQSIIRRQHKSTKSILLNQAETKAVLQVCGYSHETKQFEKYKVKLKKNTRKKINISKHEISFYKQKHYPQQKDEVFKYHLEPVLRNGCEV